MSTENKERALALAVQSTRVVVLYGCEWEELPAVGWVLLNPLEVGSQSEGVAFDLVSLADSVNLWSKCQARLVESNDTGAGFIDATEILPVGDLTLRGAAKLGRARAEVIGGLPFGSLSGQAQPEWDDRWIDEILSKALGPL